MRFSPLILTLLVLSASPSEAQTVAPPADLAGSRVDVFVPGGYIRANLVKIDADSITIQARHAPPKVIPLSEVLRVEGRKRDSLANGAAIGAAVITLWCALICDQGRDDSTELGAMIVGNLAFGALIGAGIDAAHSSKVELYRRPAATTAPRRPSLSITFRF